MQRTHLAAAAVTAAILFALTPAGAWAADSPTDDQMQARVDAVIDEYGGTQTAWNEVTWDAGAVVLELGTDFVPFAGTDDCASGRYCVYSRTGYEGTKITYSACPATYTSFTPLLGSVRSIKNDLGSGTVRAYNGNTLKAALTPGNGTSNVTNVTKLTCS